MLACYEFTINSHGFTGSKKNRKADLFQAYATMIILSGHWFVRLPLCIIRVTRLFTGKPLIYVYAHWIGMKEPLLMGVLKAEFRHILPS